MTDASPSNTVTPDDLDVWNRLSVPPDCRAPDLLREAIGTSSSSPEEAFALLIRYYVEARPDAWARAVKTAGEAGPGPPVPDLASKTVNDLLGTIWPPLSLVHRLVAGKESDVEHAWLLKAIPEMYGTRNAPNAAARALCSQLGVHDQFHFVWWTFLALAHRGEATPEIAASALKLILLAGRALYEKSSRYIVHNIYTAGCYGLFFIARTLPEFSESPAWETLALDRMDLDWDRAWYPDGGHLERNSGYAAWTFLRELATWEFARDTGGMGGREEHYLAGLRRACRCFATTLDARGIPPLFGDEGAKHDLSFLFKNAAKAGVFPEGETPDPEADPLPARGFGVDRSRSALLPDSGIAVLRNGTGKDAVWADITFGEFAGYHSHFDLLSMDLRGFGELLLQEAARVGGYGHPLDPTLRMPEAHNAFLVDHFIYDSRPCRGEEVIWHSDDHMDVFSACHRAYRNIPPLEHRPMVASGDLVVRRTLVFVKAPGYLLVMDSVKPESGDAFNRATSGWWHSPRPFEVLNDRQARVSGTPGCLLTWARPESLRGLETRTDYETGSHQWYALRARTWMDENAPGCPGLAAVLFPFRAEAPAVDIRALDLAGGVRWRADAFEVCHPGGTDVLVLNPEMLQGVVFEGRRVQTPGLVRTAAGTRFEVPSPVPAGRKRFP